ncbi:MAG: metal-sulfur cluster assembly factor [Spirochaetota bacterium]
MIKQPESELEKEIYESIKLIEDPELFISIMELGLIYSIEVKDENRAEVKMTFTSMACPAGPQLKTQVYNACMRIDKITDAEVEVVWNPPWDPHTMASEDAKIDLGID